ncbi:MAG: hypothetical protein HXS46_13030 [Theionarchaea archaeon]|nr:hypothetical protein [Theionarchaea archaeon]
MLKEHQIDIAYRIFRGYVDQIRLSHSKIHREYSDYSTKRATSNLLNDMRASKTIVGPRIWCNSGYEVKLVKETNEDPLILYEKLVQDPKVSYVMALEGYHNFLVFKNGATILKFAKAIVPSYPSKKTLYDIDPTEKGKLPIDHYPEKWDEYDWRVYELMRDPNVKYWKVGQKIGMSWQTAKRRFWRIMKQCKVFVGFYPLGFDSYSQAIITFKTEYEIGIMKELEKIDRSSFIFKFDDTIILFLSYENTSMNYPFSKLRKEGKICDLHISNPVKYTNRF